MATITYEQKFFDSRGTSFSANCILVKNNKVYYCGFPVTHIEPTEQHRSKSYRSILYNGFELGMIALREGEVNSIKAFLDNSIAKK